MLAMIERFVRLEKCVRSALIAAGSEVSFSDADIALLKQLCNVLRPVKKAVDHLNQRDANLLSAERINKIVFDTLHKLATDSENPNPFAQNFLDILKGKIELRRPSNLVHLMEYLHDPSYIKNTTMDYFGIKPQKKKIRDLAIELLGRLFSVEDTDENEGQNAASLSYPKLTKSASCIVLAWPYCPYLVMQRKFFV